MPHETEEETYASPLWQMGGFTTLKRNIVAQFARFFRPEENDLLTKSAAREQMAICEGGKWKFSRSFNLPQNHRLLVSHDRSYE